MGQNKHQHLITWNEMAKTGQMPGYREPSSDVMHVNIKAPITTTGEIIKS